MRTGRGAHYGCRVATEQDQQDESAAEASEERHVPSNVDAMGNDKRRQVIGQAYGPSVRKQFTVWGAVVATVIVLGLIGVFVVGEIDNQEKPLENTAPWAQEGVDQLEPQPIDYPRNGPEANDPQAPTNPPPLGEGEVPKARDA